MFVYTATFEKRPLKITLTSAINGVGGYITAVEQGCPADKDIELNSKVTAVNGKPVENLDIDAITGRIGLAPLPIELKLVHPNGLGKHEIPDPEPEDVWFRAGDQG